MEFSRYWYTVAPFINRDTPRADVDDVLNGAEFVPDQVTEARKTGESVVFLREEDDKSQWYWLLGDEKIYHVK